MTGSKFKQLQNIEFLLDYFQALNVAEKTSELCDRRMTDKSLKEHIRFFDAILPNYDRFVDEMIAEGNRVVVRARLEGVLMKVFLMASHLLLRKWNSLCRVLHDRK